VQLPFPNWKGAGVAIPVFSLRSTSGFGTGEFGDIKLLVDWAKLAGLKVIQLLPVNDTTATHTYADSYPYAAISAFACTQLYLNLQKVAGEKNRSVISALKDIHDQINELPNIDYERVMKLKFDTVKKLYALQKEAFKNDTSILSFLN
jgi:4-alpha-glucanotransferase